MWTGSVRVDDDRFDRLLPLLGWTEVNSGVE